MPSATEPAPLTPEDEDAARHLYRYLLHTHGGKTELRVILDRKGKRRLSTSFFAHTEEEFVDLTREWKDRRDVYAGMGERRPDLTGDATEGDVTHLSSYAIDADAKRGTVDDAKRLAYAVQAWFIDNGFAPPITTFTGGGYHLWFAFPTITFASDAERDAFKQRMKRFVYDLHDEFKGRFGGAEVDKPVHDLARIMRVPGTANVKRGGVKTHLLEPLERREDAKLLAHIQSLEPLAAHRVAAKRGAIATPSTVALAPRPVAEPVGNTTLRVSLAPEPLTDALRSLDPATRAEMEQLLQGRSATRESGSSAERALVFLQARRGHDLALIDTVLSTAHMESHQPGITDRTQDIQRSQRDAILRGIHDYIHTYTRTEIDGHPVHHGDGGAYVDAPLPLPPKGHLRLHADPTFHRLARERVRQEARLIHAGRTAEAYRQPTRYQYAPDPGVSIVRLDRLHPYPSKHAQIHDKHGTPARFEGAILHVPHNSKAREHFPTPGESADHIIIKLGAKPRDDHAISPESAYGKLTNALNALEPHPNGDLLPAYAIIWTRHGGQSHRRANAGRTYTNIHLTHDAHEARELAKLDDEDAILTRSMPKALHEYNRKKAWRERKANTE